MLPLALLPFLGASEATGQRILFVVAALSAALGVLGNNAWVSWMGELVPRRIRGRYDGQHRGTDARAYSRWARNEDGLFLRVRWYRCDG